MRCYIHSERDAVGTCVSCGKFICSECNTEISGKNYCKHCVSEIMSETKRKIEKLEDNSSKQQPMVFMNAGGGGGGSSSSSSSSAAGGSAQGTFVCTKSRMVAALLAIFLGSLGAHKFYLNRFGLGILYLIFSWTIIPGVLGFIEGIILLATNDQTFNAKYGTYVR